MTKYTRLTTFSTLLLLGAGCSTGHPEVTELPEFESRAAYAIGQDVGGSLAGSGVTLDFDALVQGLRDALDEREPLLDETEVMEAIQEFQVRAQEAMMAKEEEAASANQAEGESYLAEHGSREGVITTESGLQYRVLQEGDGATPGPQDRVRVHYRGTFVNGEPFDSSHDRGEPSVFSVSGVIPGWTEALQLMSVGSRIELVIPAHLAYGPQGPPMIGPNRTLLFELELLGIEN